MLKSTNYREGRNLLLRRIGRKHGLRYCGNVIFALTIALLSTSALMPGCILANETSVNLKFDIFRDDTLTIYIWPPVENLSVNCNPQGSNRFWTAFSSRWRQYGRELSVVYFTPSTSGVYNVLVSFSSSATWNATIGVYPSNIKFYQRIGTISVSQGYYFVELQKITALSSGQTTNSHYKISIDLRVYEQPFSETLNISFPSTTNMILFAVISTVLIYLNAFFVTDLYFKRRAERATRIRLALVALLALISLLIIYQLYVALSG